MRTESSRFTSSTRLMLILIMALILAMASVCLSFAGNANLYPQYVASIDTSSPGAYVDDTSDYYRTESSGTNYYNILLTGTPTSVYIFAVSSQNSSLSSIVACSASNTGYSIYVPWLFVRTDNTEVVRWLSGSGPCSNAVNVGTVDNPQYMYSSGLFSVQSVPDALRVFTSIQEGCEYYSNYVPEPEVANVYGFNLERGNVVYIDFGHVGVNYYAYITSTFDEWSWQGLTGHAYWQDDNRLWFWTSSLPSDEDITQYTSGNSFNWQKYGDSNIWGQTKQGYVEWDENSISPNRYLVIVNPNSKHTDNNQTVYNKPLHISIVGIPSGDSIHTYQLRQYVGAVEENGTVVGNGLVSEYNPATQESYTTNITYDSNTGQGTGTTINDNSGSASEIPPGGANAPLDSPSIEEYVGGLTNTLNKFVNQILGLLQAPLSHIQNLINSGSEFMTALANMFTWLPQPVFSVITSALILLIVIGVLKLLL